MTNLEYLQRKRYDGTLVLSDTKFIVSYFINNTDIQLSNLLIFKYQNGINFTRNDLNIIIADIFRHNGRFINGLDSQYRVLNNLITELEFIDGSSGGGESGFASTNWEQINMNWELITETWA